MPAKIREFPEGLTAEDTMRKLIGEQDVYSAPAMKTALDRVFEMLDEDQEIDVSL